MSKRVAMISTVLLVSAFVFNPGIAMAPPVAPGETCETTDADGLVLEICGAKPGGGIGEFS